MRALKIIKRRIYSDAKEYEKMNAVKTFEKIYCKNPEYTVFTPYRICPIGAHVDHQLGSITGFAIDKGVHIAYGAKQNGVVEIQSLQFKKRAQWHVNSVPEKKQDDWADHLRGATLVLSQRYMLKIGICAIIDGELPIGGLSSSAAVIISFIAALAKLNDITLSPGEMIQLSKEAENKYVGVYCGKLDQSCEVYCKKEHLLYMNMQDDSYELIPENKNMKPFEIAIIFSGLERSLAGSKYNMRVDECRSSAYALKAFAGMEYGKYEDTYLYQVPEDVFNKYKDKLPENWRKRAEHFYSEQQRVREGVKAWRKGDIEEFGRIIFESGRSSIENYETGSDELKKLYEILLETEGVYGGRFSGAGFKGCAMALVNPDYKEKIECEVTKKYLKEFPQFEGKFGVYFAKTADGVKLS